MRLTGNHELYTKDAQFVYRIGYCRSNQNKNRHSYRRGESTGDGSKRTKCTYRTSEKVKLTSEEIREALKDATGQIVEAVHGVLEKTPPELAADIVDRGIVLAGGGALLRGMDALIEQRTGVNTLTVQNAMHVVAVGTGKYAEIMSRMES